MIQTTQFTVKEREIPGLLEIDISAIEDDRGYFQEKFQKAKLVAAGFPSEFIPVQQNISYNKEAGVIRGVHAEPWDKYISIIAGKVFAVFVDLRPGDSFGKKVEIEINDRKAVFVPNGVGNSYQTLVPNTTYSYLVNDHWSADKVSEYKSVNPTDSDLNIHWPIENAIISEKDRNNPKLKDIK